ncbi:hypothetical protein AT268_17390 [Bacillus cereus]|uniref:Uncharacterized protein n=1 Tax=Bacillus cereus TaxID=1396 RepID=A0A9X0MCD7_BACCE|nr:hypothetical protein [Bacillus cereus]KXY30081.1 hypothetical protein AT268_17390 [Bacillus cereus]
MAKLDGVKVVNETVEYNGFVYELTKEEARQGDLIQCLEDGVMDLTYGAFYQVIGTDEYDDMQFLDDDNDERDRSVTDEEYKVFRKSHEITNDNLTDAEGGKEGTVKIELPDGTKLEGTPSDLEKITRKLQEMQVEQRSSVEMPEEAVEVENASEPVSERLQVGDYAKVITHDDNGQSKFGDIVKVTEDDESNVPFDTKHLDGSYAGWHYENDLVRATEDEVKAATATKDEPLKIGDYARVVGNESDVYEKGSIVKITDVPYEKWDYQAIGIKKDDEIEDAYEQFFERELVKATDEETLEVKQALLKEGDFARVIANTTSHYFEVGTVVKLDEYSEETDAFSAYYLDGSDFWRIYRSDLEPLTKEETEHITRETEEEKKAKAEREKWAAIGRKVGEIKDGDVVKVTDNTNGSHLNKGDIGEVSQSGGRTFRVNTPDCTDVNWFVPGRVELIVPVEQRFDTVG